jgi:valyl-tRNA synthetase
VLTNLEGIDPENFNPAEMTLTDRWILSRLAATAAEVTSLLEEFKYNEPLAALYKFFWNDLCDWYLEWAKPRMQDEKQKPIVQNILAFSLDQTLRLMHPFVPFITEGIFAKLNQIVSDRKLKGLAELKPAAAIVVAEWPKNLESFIDPTVELQIELIQSTIRVIRDIRNKYTVAPSQKLKATANTAQATADILNDNIPLICSLAGLSEFACGTDIKKPDTAAAAIVDDVQVYVHDLIDIEAERNRLLKQKEQIENFIKPMEAKLANENFVTRAKPEVVNASREKLADLQEQLRTIQRHLSELKA